MYSIPEV